MPNLAVLIEAERPRLEEVLGRIGFETIAFDDDHCAIADDRFTLHFYSRPSQSAIDSSIELHRVPTHRIRLSDHLHTWLVLKSRGEDWPRVEPENSIRSQLRREIDNLSKALLIIRDATMLRETLLWEAGYIGGYSRWD